MNVIKILSAIGHDIREIIGEQYPFINSGGCAIYARILGKALEEAGFDVSYTVLVKSWDKSDENFHKYSHSIKSLNWRKMYVMHVFVAVGWGLMDSNGFKSIRSLGEWDYQRLIHDLKSDIIDKWLEEEKLWNSGFRETMNVKTQLIEATRYSIASVMANTNIF